MSEAPVGMTAVLSHPFRSRLKSLLSRILHWLYKYHPRVKDWRFWAVQGLVIGIAAIHGFIEAGGYLPQLKMLYFIPISLFFVPVVYAALNFGFVGSISTAVWIVVITIPNWIFWHEGLERLGVIFQLAIIVAMAVFVGQRVDRETSARRRAEEARTLRRDIHGDHQGERGLTNVAQRAERLFLSRPCDESGNHPQCPL